MRFYFSRFSVRFGGAVFDDFGAVGRSVGQSGARSVGRSGGRSVGRSGARSVGPPSPLAPKEVWSDIAYNVCELSLVWRRLNMG